MRNYAISFVILVVAAAIISFGFVITFHRSKPDLIIQEIKQPEYVYDIKGTVVKVIVKNIGDAPSEKTKAKIYDIDISVEQARKMKLDTLFIDLIAENNARAKWYKDNESYKDVVTQYDYDRYVEDIQEVPTLKPSETTEITFRIEDHWVYDSNCELEAYVDFEDQVKEDNEKNNIKQFFGWG